MRRLIGFATIFGALSCLALLMHNNLTLRTPSTDDFEESYERGVNWLYENRETLHEVHNSAMWWMLGRAAELRGDARLARYVDDYRRAEYSRYENSAWRYLVLGSQPYLDVDAVLSAGLPPYMLYFVYSYTCDTGLGEVTVIREQHDTGFCASNQPLAPACLTHQMIGFLFQKAIACGDMENLTHRIDELALKIQRQAFFDVRLVDVYLQRALVLVDSGHGDKVRARWLNRILDAQLDDGGWGGFKPLVPLGGGRYFGLTGNGVGIRAPVSDLHASAQGILLMALLSTERQGQR